MGKINVAIIFGGKSAEHEVSLQSAKNVYEAIDKTKYNPVLIGIEKSGKWLLNNKTSEFLLNSNNPKTISLEGSGDPIALAPQSAGKISNLNNAQDGAVTIDVAFPILHGPFGEDGSVQGLLKMANIPYVGSGILGSALGMDKDLMKRVLRDAGIPIGKFVAIKDDGPLPSFAEVKNVLGSPVFVKPANMGSSVGVAKAENEDEFKKAAKTAFDFDVKIIVEEFVPGREIECAVLGNSNPQASVPGEVIPTNGFYSYEAKYIDENGAALEIPAKLPETTVKKIQEYAIKTFKALNCEGLSRVDFFLKDNGDILVNEINTIPGFTKISMYPQLWNAGGISYTELIDRLIQLALERFEKEKKLKTDYISE